MIRKVGYKANHHGFFVVVVVVKIPVAFVLLERTTRWHYFTAECAFTSEISHGITRSHQFISWLWGLKANQFAILGNNAICRFRCTKQIPLLFSRFHNTKNNAVFCFLRFRNTHTTVSLLFSGLKTKPFLGIPYMQQVECSGSSLPSGSSLYAMVIYERRGDRIVSSVDIQNKECSTSDYFNACSIDDRQPRKTRLTILVSDLSEGESREYGCNASLKTSSGRFKVESWFITVRGLSK